MFGFKTNKRLKVNYDRLNQKYSELRYRESQQKEELTRLIEVEIEHKFMESLLKKYEVIGIEFNSEDEKNYVCTLIYDNNISIYLKNVYDRHPFPRGFAKLDKNFDGNGMVVCTVIDIYAVKERIGNGSTLLSYLINYAKEQGAWEMRGDLSYEDRDRFDELAKFYKASGFAVKFNEDKTQGSIRLKL